MKKKIINISIILIILSPFIIWIGSQIFWGLAMGRVETYPSTPQEDQFIENLGEKTNLLIYSPDLPKKNYTNLPPPEKHIQDLYISNYRYGGEDAKPKITLDKTNIQKFSDSVFTEFMKVYSLKEVADSLCITFHLDSLQDKKTKIYYDIDTTFQYKIK